MRTRLAILALAIIGTATACQIPAPVGKGCTEVLLTEKQLAAADFIGHHPRAGEWVAENGDGPILGYSFQEDGRIYNTEACAKLNPVY